MTAADYSITIEQGADFPFLITWTDSAGTIIDITGYSAQFMIRQNYTDVTPLVSLSSPSNGITLGGTAGTISIDIPFTTTAALPAMLGEYDLKLIDPSGKPIRLLEGSATISPAVTR